MLTAATERPPRGNRKMVQGSTKITDSHKRCSPGLRAVFPETPVPQSEVQEEVKVHEKKADAEVPVNEPVQPWGWGKEGGDAGTSHLTTCYCL